MRLQKKGQSTRIKICRTSGAGMFLCSVLWPSDDCTIGLDFPQASKCIKSQCPDCGNKERLYFKMIVESLSWEYLCISVRIQSASMKLQMNVRFSRQREGGTFLNSRLHLQLNSCNNKRHAHSMEYIYIVHHTKSSAHALPFYH